MGGGQEHEEIAPAALVSDDRGLRALVSAVENGPAVAIDCEQNGLYAYRPRVCLVQVSCEGRDWIIDPMGPADMSLLAPVFADESIVKIFHAAEEDVIGLARDFGLVVVNLFDTMWAAKMLGWPRLGLAPILEERHGIVLDKRMQRHDWGKRPLEQVALAYAQLDTHYLVGLYREQHDALVDRGRLEDAEEIFAELAESRAVAAMREPWAYRIKGEKELTDRERAVAHELADARDEQARRRDKPAFKIIGDRELLAIASAHPTSVAALGKVPDVSPRLVERHGAWLVEAVRRGLESKPPPRPPKRPRDDAAVRRYEAMRAWRNRIALEHSIPGEVIVPNDVLLLISRAAPADTAQLAALGLLGPRRLDAYGDGLLEAMRSSGPGKGRSVSEDRGRRSQ